MDVEGEGTPSDTSTNPTSTGCATCSSGRVGRRKVWVVWRLAALSGVAERPDNPEHWVGDSRRDAEATSPGTATGRRVGSSSTPSDSLVLLTPLEHRRTGRVVAVAGAGGAHGIPRASDRLTAGARRALRGAWTGWSPESTEVERDRGPGGDADRGYTASETGAIGSLSGNSGRLTGANGDGKSQQPIICL